MKILNFEGSSHTQLVAWLKSRKKNCLWNINNHLILTYSMCYWVNSPVTVLRQVFSVNGVRLEGVRLEGKKSRNAGGILLC